MANVRKKTKRKPKQIPVSSKGSVQQAATNIESTNQQPTRVISLPRGTNLLTKSLKLIWREKKFFAVLLIIIALLNLVLISTSVQDAGGIKESVSENLGTTSAVTTNVTTFALLLGGTLTSTDAA